jgi:hypothetical protein
MQSEKKKRQRRMILQANEHMFPIGLKISYESLTLPSANGIYN